MKRHSCPAIGRHATAAAGDTEEGEATRRKSTVMRTQRLQLERRVSDGINALRGAKALRASTLQHETLILRNKRRLGYFIDRPAYDIVDQRNLPYVFLFHGMFDSGSRFVMETPPNDCVFVVCDRPGYGRSDHSDHRTWTYAQFAMDMGELADHIGIDKFYVAGHSSGGPCALACGAHLQSRVLGIAVISGDPEYAAPGAPKEKMMSRLMLRHFVPSIFSAVSLCGTFPDLNKGNLGAHTDYQVERKPYDFRVEDISQPTVFIVGERDTMLPRTVAEYNHSRIPGSDLLIIKGAGHLSVLDDTHLKAILHKLLRSAARCPA